MPARRPRQDQHESISLPVVYEAAERLPLVHQRRLIEMLIDDLPAEESEELLARESGRAKPRRRRQEEAILAAMAAGCEGTAWQRASAVERELLAYEGSHDWKIDHDLPAPCHSRNLARHRALKLFAALPNRQAKDRITPRKSTIHGRISHWFD